MELVALIVLGLIILGFLAAVLRQWALSRQLGLEHSGDTQPIVPVNLAEHDNAIVLVEGRARVIYINDRARSWFSLNGDTPTLTSLAARAHPPDSFRDLFISEGRSAFRLGKRHIEATSHYIPGEANRRMVVVLREMTQVKADGSSFDSGQAVALIAQLSNLLAAQNPLEETLESVLEEIRSAINFDLGEINYWEAERNTLRSAIRIGNPTDLALPHPAEYGLDDGFSGWIARYRQQLLVQDTSNQGHVELNNPYPFGSFIGLPLMMGEKLVGSLELAHHQPQAFDYQDMSLLHSVVGQLAIAIENNHLERDQSNRLAELGGLQKIAGAMQYLTKPYDMYGQLTNSLAQLMNVDIATILLLDDTTQELKAQSPSSGLSESLIPYAKFSVQKGSFGYSLWLTQSWWFTNSAFGDPTLEKLGLNELVELARLRGVGWTPLLVGTQRIGAILVANPKQGTELTKESMRTLTNFASEVAIVVESGRLYRQEKRRAEELSGLQRIAAAVGHLSSPSDLYTQVTSLIAQLMNAEMCGILLHDSQRNLLVLNPPMFGGAGRLSMPYEVPLDDSPLVQSLWQEKSLWYTNHVLKDIPRESQLGLICEQLMARKTMFAALHVGGKRLGFIQLINRLDSNDFDNEDAEILSIFAGQAELLIDNARLYSETHQRYVESDNLRHIAEQLAGSVELEEIIELVLAATAQLLKSDALAVGMLDTMRGKLAYQAPYIYGFKTDEPVEMDIFDPDFINSVTLSRRMFFSNDLVNDANTISSYQRVAKQLGFYNAMMVPLVIQDRTIGEIGAFNKPGGFGDNDKALLYAVAAQIAAAIERVRLYESTDEDLRIRVQELDTIDRIGQELAETLDLSHIMEVTRSEVTRVTGAESVTVVVFAVPEEWPNPRQPVIEKRLGGDRELGSGLAQIEEKALQIKQTMVVGDYKESELTPLPPQARSAIAEPMLIEGQVIGLLHVFSSNPTEFGEKERRFLSRVARQAALAVTNAQRYRQQLRTNELLTSRASQLSKVYSLGQMIRQGSRLETVLGELARSLSDSVGFRKVLVQVLDEDTQISDLVAHYGLTARDFKDFPQLNYTADQVQLLLQERWEIGKKTYFLPSELQAEWFTKADTTTGTAESRRWNDADLFVAPMMSAERSPRLLGWISLSEPISKLRPSQAVAETLEIFATEAAFSLENYRLLKKIRDEANSARSERDRLALLHLVASDIQRAPDMASRLQAVVDGIQAAGWEKVHLSLRDEQLESTMLVQAGYNADEMSRLNSINRSGQVWKARLADPLFQSTRIGSTYYARYDHPWTQENVFRGQPPMPPAVDDDRWHPQDILYMPLYGQTEDRIIGILGLEAPRDGARPSEMSLQPLELFSTQAAAAIENTRLYLETLRQRETEQRLTDMMESVSASLEIEKVLQTMADGLRQMIAFTRMHVALPHLDRQEFQMRRVEVLVDKDIFIFDDDPVAMEGTAMAACYQSRKAATYQLRTRQEAELYPDLLKWYNQGERISMMVPMVAGGQIMGVLRLGSELFDAYGFNDRMDLVGRMANLSAVSINHSRLLDDLRATISYNEAVAESIQQGIVVLDQHLTIKSISDFMRQRYGWTNEAIGKNLYEQDPEFKSFLQHSIADALKDGIPQHQFEIQDFDAQGNRMIRNFYTYPLRQGEVVTGVVLVVEDVTERAMLESNLAQRAEQLNALTQVSSKITSTLATDEVVNLVLEALENVMQFDGVTLWLREADRLNVMAARGFKDPNVARTEELIGLWVDIESSALFGEMAMDQSILNVGDTGANDPRFPGGEIRVYKNWLGAPLISQGEIIGVIAIEKREPNYYDANHEQLLQAFANQASIALRNAQLFEQTTQRAQELDSQTRRLELLNRVAVALAHSLDIENIFEITLRETAIALDIDEGVAMKIDHEHEVARVVVEYPRGDEEPEAIFYLADNPVARRLQETMVPYVVNMDDERYAPHIRAWLRRDDITSSLLVPLVVGGSAIGMMRFDSIQTDGQFFTQERQEIAQTLASQAAIAVQNASLFEQSVMRTHELETLFEASQATSVTLDLDEAMRRVVRQIMGALRADYCSISLWDEVENHLEVREATTAWGDSQQWESDGSPYIDTPGTIYSLSAYPLREQALRQREVIKLRQDAFSQVDESEAQVMRSNGAKDRMLVPLVVNDYSIGLIDLEIREQSRYFDPSDVRLARTLASQSAIAIENARLQTETRAQIEELYIINDLSTAVSSKVNLDELFPMIRDQLPLLTDADILYVALYDNQQHTLSFPIAVQSDGDPIAMPHQQLGADEFSYVVNLKAPLLLWGARMPEARRSYGIETQLPDAKCFLGVPMMAGDEVLGVLAVQDDEDPRAFGLNDQRILTTVASQLGVAVQNARLFARTTELTSELEQRVVERTSQLDQERQRVQTLYEITREVAASLDINHVVFSALEKVAQAIGAASAVVLGMDEVSEQLYVMHAWGGLPVEDEMERTQLRQDQGLAGWVIANRQGVVIHDVQKDDRWDVTGNRDLSQRSAVAALLEVGDDVRGVMMFFGSKVNAFDDEHLKLVTAAASQLASSMNNAELYTLIRDQAERLGAILREEQRESTKNTAILDSVSDGIMYANDLGNVVLFNTSAERILGLPNSRVAGRSITELTGLYGGSGNLWREALERWMNDPASYRSEDFVEELLELEDGRVVSVRLSPVNMGDQFLGTVSVFRDITKSVEIDRLKTEFVATVSHELRTPMTSIKGYADLLLLGAAGEVTDAQQRFLETIKQNADRLSILVNDLLEVSRIDQGRVPLHFSTVEVGDLLQTIADHLHVMVEEKEKPIKIIQEVEANLPPLRADYDKIIQIMQNLADNAFTFTLGDGQVTLGAYQDTKEKRVVMFVKDTGIGIPPNVGDRVFERFYRGEEYQDVSLDTPGTGLGLSIVKSLVEIHGGSIWYESEVGKGTTFYVRLPVAEEGAESPQTETEAGEPV